VTIELVVFLSVLVAVAVIGTIVVRRTLRPLGEIAQTAAEIARRPMGSGSVSLPERAPVGRPGSEVAIVASAVNTLVDEVESALVVREASEERLRQFIADASHELRTPVAVIRGYAEVAQRIGGDQPDEVRHSLQRIVGESERIGHLVDDLLLLARLDSGLELQHEEVDLTHAVLEAMSDAQVVDRSHIWRLDLPEEPVLVDADGPGVHQVVSNLLTNARTHTPPGTSVTTRLRVLPNGDAELTVTDDGPGLPPELAARAFERFVRGQDGRQTSTGSSGLGLPIVAAIIEAHGGTISLDGQHGCTVRIVFPAHHVHKGD
jgi:two-component system OmpR family sensor kinase